MRRNRIQMLKEALLAIDEKHNKSSIFYKLCTATNIAEAIFQALLRTEMIEPDGEGYRVTDKGRRFIETTNKLEEMLK